jgi:hypothetical protein
MVSAADLDVLERAARERTGLSDFGAGDWRDALARLLDAAGGEARLSEAGEAIVRMQAVDRLANRLEIQAWLSAHPEVDDETVAAPLVLATLPRTGQTAAGWILDRDPAHRSLLTWFAKRPAPPPTDLASDPRIEEERARVRLMPRAVLDMHLYDAEEPDECHWLLSNDMKVPHEIYAMSVPAYYRWVRDEADMASAYRYYARQLAMLQSPQPARRWVLKNSPHLLFLDALHAVMPDAIFVQFHRDPLKVLASNCRLSMILRAMGSERVDAHEVGAHMLLLLGDYLDGLLAFRASDRSRPWVDVGFPGFVRDPLAAIAGLYDAAGLPLTVEAEGSMAGWIAAHPRRDLARATPADLAPWGIDPAAARERFAPYVERFGVEYDGI